MLRHVDSNKIEIAFLSVIVFFASLLFTSSCGKIRPESPHQSVTINQIQTQSNPQGVLNWQIGYDDQNWFTHFTDPAGKQTKINNELDEQGKIRRQVKTLPDGSEVNYAYDVFERRISMSDPLGETQYEYAGFDRLVSVRRKGMPAVSYTYDTLDRLKAILIGDKGIMEYGYDFLGRIAKMKTPAGDISYEYQTGQNIIIRSLPNSIQTAWEFYPGGNLQSITHTNRDHSVLLQFTYFYRPDGLVDGIKEWRRAGERTIKYEYDIVQRLIGIRDSDGMATRYEYDKLGNRTIIEVIGESQDLTTYDWAGRMITHNGQPCSYDNAGNLLAYADKNGTVSYAYNADNQLKTIDGANIGYSYDGDGSLLHRSYSWQSTNFIADPKSNIWRPIGAIDQNGHEKYYIWEGEIPLAVISNEGTDFFLQDYLGSVRGIANSRGQLTEQIDYDPFGLPLLEKAGKDLQPRFAGMFYEPGTFLYATRSRGYDANLGRFLQVDPQCDIPLGSQKNLCMYAYCGSDPINFYDRNGANFKWVWGPENAAWQGFHNLFNINSAHQFYASKSQQAVSNSYGRIGWATAEATMWDLIGGFVPGKAANQGQGIAQIAWSLLPGVAPGTATLKGLGFARGFVSSARSSNKCNSLL
jgi:RHS repeat-associated protein